MGRKETYIKMCDCPEIQSKWVLASGYDRIIGRTTSKIEGVDGRASHLLLEIKSHSTVPLTEEYIWLPR